MEFFNTKHLPVALLLVIVLVIVFSIVRLSHSHLSKINIDDLLLGEDGTMSRSACILLGSFGVTTWGMVFMWLNEKMTEGYFLAYCAVWATPAVTKLIVNGNMASAKTAADANVAAATAAANAPAQPPAPIVGQAGDITISAK